MSDLLEVDGKRMEIPSGRSAVDGSGGGGPPRDWQGRILGILARSPRLALSLGAVLGLLLGTAGAVSTLGTPVTWTSQTVMILDDPYGLAAAGDEGPLLKLNEVRAKYASLAGTYAIAQPVALRLGIPVGEVLGHESAVPSPDALLLVVTATWTDAPDAEKLSAATAAELTSYVQSENAAYAIPTTDQFLLRTVDPTGPAVPSRPSKGRAATQLAGWGLGGFAVGFVLTQLVRSRRLRA